MDEIVLVTGAGDVDRCRSYVRAYGLSKVTTILAGGKERQDSVCQGLAALGDRVEWVLVHDGVRPFAAETHVRACLRQAELTEAAVLAVPVKDTIKIVNREGVIEATPDRSSLWAIQTPQAFRLALLLEAHAKAREEGFTVRTTRCWWNGSGGRYRLSKAIIITLRLRRRRICLGRRGYYETSGEREANDSRRARV